MLKRKSPKLLECPYFKNKRGKREPFTHTRMKSIVYARVIAVSMCMMFNVRVGYNDGRGMAEGKDVSV